MPRAQTRRSTFCLGRQKMAKTTGRITDREEVGRQKNGGSVIVTCRTEMMPSWLFHTVACLCWFFANHEKSFTKKTFFFADVLNVSGRFNSDELTRDMTVGDDITDEPFFEERPGIKAPHNVSALIGKTAFLTCVVRNLGKAKSVSHINFSLNKFGNNEYTIFVQNGNFCPVLVCVADSKPLYLGSPIWLTSH